MQYKEFSELASKIQSEGSLKGSSPFGETYQLDNMVYFIADGGYCQCITINGVKGKSVYELKVGYNGSKTIFGITRGSIGSR